MKKLFILATVCCFAFGLTSCKKEYTCKCTATVAGSSATSETKIEDTKKNAKEACDKGDASSTAGGITTSVACEIE
jgi:hypothetical protein